MEEAHVNKQSMTAKQLLQSLPIGEAFAVYLLKNNLITGDSSDGLKYEVYEHIFKTPFFNFLYKDSPEGIELINALIADVNNMDVLRVKHLSKV